MNKRQKILIVDDAKFNRDILKEFLGETYDYLEAENGNQAVQIMEENLGIDLMLLDINMPQMDGLTATKTIRSLERQDAKTIPIIAMTANAFREDAERCMEAGMNAHLAKPLDDEKMIVALKQCMADNSDVKLHENL